MNRSYADTVSRLASAQKSARGASPYAQLINRPAGRRFAACSYVLGLTPNQVTAISALLTFAGIAVLAIVPSSVLVGVICSVLLVLGYALDSADGQLARLRGGGSTSGEWLDHMVDSTKIVALHLAVLVGLYRFGHMADRLLLIPLGFTVVATVTFFGKILNDQLRRNCRSLSADDERPGFSTAAVLLASPCEYGIIVLSILLWGWGSVFIWAYGVLAAFSAAFLIVALPRWYLEMDSLGGRLDEYTN